MAQLKTKRMVVYEVLENAIGGGLRSYGLYDNEPEAMARYQQVAAAQPNLVVSMSLNVTSRHMEVVEAAADEHATKMRRAGRDYEDKAVTGAVQ